MAQARMFVQYAPRSCASIAFGASREKIRSGKKQGAQACQRPEAKQRVELRPAIRAAETGQTRTAPARSGKRTRAVRLQAGQRPRQAIAGTCREARRRNVGSVDGTAGESWPGTQGSGLSQCDASAR